MMVYRSDSILPTCELFGICLIWQSSNRKRMHKFSERWSCPQWQSFKESWASIVAFPKNSSSHILALSQRGQTRHALLQILSKMRQFLLDLVLIIFNICCFSTFFGTRNQPKTDYITISTLKYWQKRLFVAYFFIDLLM